MRKINNPELVEYYFKNVIKRINLFVFKFYCIPIISWHFKQNITMRQKIFDFETWNTLIIHTKDIRKTFLEGTKEMYLCFHENYFFLIFCSKINFVQHNKLAFCVFVLNFDPIVMFVGFYNNFQKKVFCFSKFNDISKCFFLKRSYNHFNYISNPAKRVRVFFLLVSLESWKTRSFIYVLL